MQDLSDCYWRMRNWAQLFDRRPILDNHKVTEYERMSLKTAWKTDMQLFSEYLDRKVRIFNKIFTRLTKIINIDRTLPPPNWKRILKTIKKYRN